MHMHALSISIAQLYNILLYVGTKLGIGFALAGVAGMVVIAIVIIVVTLCTKYRFNRTGRRYRVIRMTPATVATEQEEFQPAEFKSKQL